MEQTYIDIMIQSLEKKEQVLDRIIELDIKQKNQLEDPQLTPDDFDEVVEAKSRLIDQLNNLDSGFEKLFERTKEELNGHKEDYKEQIRTMQEHIRSITDKSVKIQSQEARNKDLPVQTGDKTRNNLRGNEFEIVELFIADNIFELVHGYKPEKIKKRL